jgi:uncharacterized protein with ATP-grasp and redox domains
LEVKRHFETADLIIANGQGNYEALSDEPYPIYFKAHRAIRPAG